ncbi:histidinol-phosphate transaminase [Pseudonocardia acaciae]|uniref:histidinol-phosphate transaminase n=1 Tax=Pseudonocardia acaciae TaxID=551276 RepID=UPI00048B4C9E|nr:histidinol-phosphate transaminase [Pseudonocardia acaciae]
MDPTIRADLDALPAYIPGRTIPGAIKLASNEVALPPPRPVLDAIAEAAAAGNRYPDMAVTSLTARLAERHGVSADQVATGCGSVSLCQQLVQITCGSPDDEVLMAWRSFEAYPIVTRVGNARPVQVPLDAAFRHDPAAMAAAITPNTRLVFVCNPNNPTGTVLRRDELLAFLDEVPAHVVVALDEAYREFVTDPEVPDGLTLLADRPNLVVLRTFSKAYRLAGLRVGYAVASPTLVAALRRVAPAFGVNSLAQAAACAALDCLPELLDSCSAVVAERARVRAELVAAGYQVPETEANFVWLPLRERAAEFAAHCEQQKVIVRPFAGDGVRVTVADAGENDAFLAAARSFPGQGASS